MSNISIRKLDIQVVEKLKLLAAHHGVSMEEEIRTILGRAVSAPERISDIFLKHFGPKNGVILQESSPYPPHEPMDFE